VEPGLIITLLVAIVVVVAIDKTRAARRRRMEPPKIGGYSSAFAVQDRTFIEMRVTNEGPSQTVAYLMWFFLGLFSGHRFYLGRPLSAILQIASYFILVGFLWLLVDAFLIPGMVRSRQDIIRQRLMKETMSAQALPQA
jgi:CDP-diglyceride synthetase